ncbi:uncharacterized protein METZ01_LOCUS304983 [marine metagenome]|uniref:Uncharacterized protein n=1 Tax=marine metagenome TaxID=408172 RepID=A0A382MTC1_9ZZZZ
MTDLGAKWGVVVFVVHEFQPPK